MAFVLHFGAGEMRAILTYHSIDSSGSVISVDPETFRSHVGWLARAGIRGVRISELVGTTTADAVALTFDDGFENFASEAWPVLREHGFGATVFVATRRAGGTNDWDGGGHAVPRLPLMGWSTLGKLAEEGVLLGGHGATHRDLRRLDAMELEAEVREPAERIARETGQRVTDFAYPYGAHDDRVVAAVRAYYSTAATTELRPLGAEEDAHRLPRVDAYYLRRAGRLEGWKTGELRRYLRYRDRWRRLGTRLRGNAV